MTRVHRVCVRACVCIWLWDRVCVHLEAGASEGASEGAEGQREEAIEGEEDSREGGRAGGRCASGEEDRLGALAALAAPRLSLRR